MIYIEEYIGVFKTQLHESVIWWNSQHILLLNYKYMYHITKIKWGKSFFFR